MKKTADVLSWIGGIIEIIAIWICVALYSQINVILDFQVFQSSVLLIIGIVLTVFAIFVLILRQIAINTESKTAVIALGVLTFFFASAPGGVLTVIYGKVWCSDYHISYNVNHVYNRQIKDSTSEYIYDKPESSDQIKIGDVVQIREGFYDSEAQRRFGDNTSAEVVDINGTYVKLSIIAGSERFPASTQINNILIKVVNPEYIKAQQKKKAEELGVPLSTDTKSEYLFMEPNSSHQIEVGSMVKVANGFYVESVRQRVQKGEICEVVSIDGDDITILINNNQSKFAAKAKAKDLLLRINNPNYTK